MENKWAHRRKVKRLESVNGINNLEGCFGNPSSRRKVVTSFWRQRTQPERVFEIHFLGL